MFTDRIEICRHRHNAFIYLIPSSHNTRSPSHEKFIRWIATDIDIDKLSTDGSVTEPSNQAGAGGIIRDSNGIWIAGFARNLGFCSVPSAECWALREGLQLAKNLNIHSLEVEMDSAFIFSLCKSNNLISHELAPIILDCRELLTTFQKVCFHHNYREANKCADILANWGRSNTQDFTFFELCPNFVLPLLLQDLKGVTTPRMTVL